MFTCLVLTNCTHAGARSVTFGANLHSQASHMMMISHHELGLIKTRIICVENTATYARMYYF